MISLLLWPVKVMALIGWIFFHANRDRKHHLSSIQLKWSERSGLVLALVSTVPVVVLMIGDRRFYWAWLIQLVEIFYFVGCVSAFFISTILGMLLKMGGDIISFWYTRKR